MKTTRFSAAALALLSALSCQKAGWTVPSDSENEGGAIITCCFAKDGAAAKTTVGTDGLTPMWVAGDKIMLYDGVSHTQELTLAASGAVSSMTGIIDGTDASKFMFAKPGGWENVYAIYPSCACASGFSADNPKLNFAGQDGTFAKANICAAVAVSCSMSFMNVGAILKFKSKSVKAAKVVVPVADMAHDFKVSFDGANPSLTSETASNSSEVSIGSGSGAIYIGVPACGIAASSVFTYKTSDDAVLGTYTTGADNTVEVNKIYSLGAMMGVLSGFFTVSAGEDGEAGTADDVKVQFSKGNLQATCTTAGIEGVSTYSWAFAEHQYDYIGHAEGNTTIGDQKLNNKVDLFGWVGASSKVLTGVATKYGISSSTNNSDYGNNSSDSLKEDWGTAIDTTGFWRTLTGGSDGEWNYLLSSRTVNGGQGESHSYQLTTLTLEDGTTTVFGLIIAPDVYQGSPALSGTTSWDNWQKLESLGCVFLPAAGYRFSSLDVIYEGTFCMYWSSTCNGQLDAYCLNCNGGYVLSYYTFRKNGCAVRLVCAAQ